MKENEPLYSKINHYESTVSDVHLSDVEFLAEALPVRDLLASFSAEELTVLDQQLNLEGEGFNIFGVIEAEQVSDLLAWFGEWRTADADRQKELVTIIIRRITE